MKKEKICTKCKETKSISCFSNSKKSIKRYYCKQCEKKLIKIYRKNNPWGKVFEGINQRCNNPKNDSYKDYGGRGIKVLFKSSKEIKELWFRDKAHNLKKPSIDRIDNDGHYEYGNCRFIEFGENSAERNKRVCSKSVLQYDLDSNFIREYQSLKIAGKITNQTGENISLCCRGKTKQAKGFIWKFKK